MAERRAQLRALVDPLGIVLAATGTHPWARGRSSGSSTRRTTGATTSSCATSSGATTPSASTSTSASAAPTARCGLNALRTCCPSCWRSRRARRSSRASTRACTRRARRSSRASSRAAASPTRSRLARVRALRPLPLRDRLDHRAHAALVERPAAPRLPDRRDPDLRRAARSRRGAGARGARVRARGAARARDRRGRAAGRPAAPADRGEPVACDPLRALRRVHRPRRGDVLPARARLERLLEWVAPVAEEIGAAPYLAIPERERRRAPDRPLRGGSDARRDLRRAGRRGPVRG